MNPVCVCGGTEYDIVRRGTYSRLGLDAVAFTIGRCRTCGLARTLPPPDDRQYETGYARFVDGERFTGKLQDDWSPIVADWVLRRTTANRVLDVGCHSGNLVAELLSRGVQAEGIDVDPIATEQGRTLGRPLTTAHVSSLEGTYDTIVLNHVIEHVGDLGGLLNDLHRLLVPGGAVFVFTPTYKGVLPQLMGDSWIGWSPLEHVWHFTPRTLRSTVQRVSPLRVRELTTRRVHETPSHGARGAAKAAVAALTSAIGRGDEIQATLERPR